MFHRIRDTIMAEHNDNAAILFRRPGSCIGCQEYPWPGKWENSVWFRNIKHNTMFPLYFLEPFIRVSAGVIEVIILRVRLQRRDHGRNAQGGHPACHGTQE